MNRSLTAKLALCVALVQPIAGKADYRADYFDLTKRPSVRFNQKALNWTIRNQAIERVVQYDAKVGSLRTTLFRDLKSGQNLIPLPNSEGSLSFSAPLMQVPKPLTGWKMTEATPGANWNKPDFSDANWKSVTLPTQAQANADAAYFRCAIPAGAMQPNKAYALVLDRALGGEAEIFLDGESALKVTPNEFPRNRTLEVDLNRDNRLVAIKVAGRNAPLGVYGMVGIAEVGTAPQAIALGADWRYMHHSVNARNDGDVLTITLSGMNRYEGFDLDVSYQIGCGAEPMMAKWFTLTSQRQSRFLMDQVVYDRWMLPGAAPETQEFGQEAFVATDKASRAVLMSAVLSPLGRAERSADGKHIASVLRPYYLIKPGQRQILPRSVTGFTRGSEATGAFLYQLYIGQYIAQGTPNSVPTVYNTRYGYGDSISAALCEQIIPLAASLGAKAFVLGDGWQSNNPNGMGKYGDWNVDRHPMKFPQGLAQVALVARANKIALGLWATPTCVSADAKAAQDRADSLLKLPEGSKVTCPEGARMCFSIGWEDAFGLSMQQLCRELMATYLRLDGALFDASCASPSHDHPVLHSLDAQEQHWAAFVDRMQGVSRDFILTRGDDRYGKYTAMSPTGAFYSWESAGDPRAAKEAGWWFRNADQFRHTLFDIALLRPGFTLSGDAPCHLPLDSPNLDALEYHLTSVAALTSNLELHGALEKMTAEEKALTQKWARWNEENREWLAYSQPLLSLGRPWNPQASNATPHVDGALHLRPMKNGKYGYLCLWNPSDTPQTPTVAFRPADYFVPMSAGAVRMVSLKNNAEIRFSEKDGALALEGLTMPPRSWEIIEIVKR